MPPVLPTVTPMFAPPRLIGLPLSVNAAEPALKVMPLKLRPAAKSLVGVGRTSPAKTSASSGAGAATPQFAAVDHLSSAPPPVQVIVAADAQRGAPKAAQSAA